MLRLASALSSPPPSLQPCSGLQNSIGPTKIRLWLILDKHFIAKPARATSLPRFVSDTIYEMGTEMKGRFTSARECLPYDTQWVGHWAVFSIGVS